jgi:hypothetical protein
VQVNEADTYGVLGLNERVVDRDNVDVLVLDAARCQLVLPRLSYSIDEHTRCGRRCDQCGRNR